MHVLVCICSNVEAVQSLRECSIRLCFICTVALGYCGTGRGTPTAQDEGLDTAPDVQPCTQITDGHPVKAVLWAGERGGESLLFFVAVPWSVVCLKEKTEGVQS